MVINETQTRPCRSSSKRPPRPKPKGNGQPTRTRGSLANGRTVEGARGRGEAKPPSLPERKFHVFLTAPRKKKPNKKSALGIMVALREKTPPKTRNHHKKTQKTPPKNAKNTPNKKNRAYARKKSPNAKKKKKPILMAPPGPSNRRNFRSVPFSSHSAARRSLSPRRVAVVT